MNEHQSWGRYPTVNQEVRLLQWRNEIPEIKSEKPVLPYGAGRSYGDCCLNEDGLLLDTSALNHFISFDKEQGILRCEAGVTLDAILKLVIPHGWFLPVTPGTRFVTIAGAVANDVHGKNHHKEGTFGQHVRAFELLRSDGQRLQCSATENADYYRATIAGLGLTGLISWVEIALKPIRSSLINSESIQFENIDEFFQLSAESDQDWEYTVSWIDCRASDRHLGRGIFYRGNHADVGKLDTRELYKPLIRAGFDAPSGLLNKTTISLFNALIYNKHGKGQKKQLKSAIPFFYPLDRIGAWNRFYGKRGFLQYQCVIPGNDARNGVEALLRTIAASGQGSFLAVLKMFGDIKSPGIMSFPRPGVTLALDFPFLGDATLKLIDQLEKIVFETDGAVYPAKDACVTSEHFAHYFPQIDDFKQYIDPGFSSSLWRRVNAHA